MGRLCRFSKLLGVAGGELVIPTLVLLFGADIKLTGSLSLAVSLPTMLVGFTRYSRDRSFVVLGENRSFVLVVAAGSIVGSFIGGRLLGLVPSAVLPPLLALILVLSAVKVFLATQIARISFGQTGSLVHDRACVDSEPSVRWGIARLGRGFCLSRRMRTRPCRRYSLSKTTPKSAT